MSCQQAQPLHGGISGKLFEELFTHNYRKCLAFARRIIRSREDAEDVTQEAFFRAFRSFDRYDGRRPFDRWMFRIIANLCLDHLRRQRKVVFYPLDAPLPGREGNDLLLELPDREADPSEQVLRHIMDERLAHALDRLPPIYRETLWLVDVEELQYDEAAEKMGCAIGTIRSRVHRARLMLHSLLNGKAPSA